ncbi:hypothetical protein ZYGR_0A01990 [Zygosaccharomyces rouxii]|nr:hypothetical protein ZYGR_0A01990 [Zygosaccharomyces rouxii]
MSHTQLNHGFFYKDSGKVNDRDSLEDLSDSAQRYFRIGCTPPKTSERIEIVHQSPQKSKITTSRTFNRKRVCVSRELPLEAKNTKGLTRVLKGAGNRYERNRIQRFEETHASRNGSAYGAYEEFDEENFTSSVSFKSFVSAVFSNSIFQNPLGEHTSNTNPFIENSFGGILDQLDGVNEDHLLICTKNESLNSCFLMRFIERRRRASAAVKEAARMASIRCKTRETARINAEEAVIQVHTRNLKLSFRDQEESKDCSQNEVNIIKDLDAPNTSLMEEANLSVGADLFFEGDIKQCGFEPTIDACWKLNDGLCPHVEALIYDSVDGDINDLKVKIGDHQPCSWLTVLVSQIEIWGTDFQRTDCWDPLLKPDNLQKVTSNAEVSASIEETNCVSKNNIDGGVSFSLQSAGGEGNFFFTPHLLNQSFVELRNCSPLFPGTVIPIVGVKEDRYMDDLSSDGNMDSAPPDIHVSRSWFGDNQHDEFKEPSHEELEEIPINGDDGNCRKCVNRQTHRTTLISECTSLYNIEDIGGDSLGLTALCKDMDSFNQMDGKATNSDFNYSMGRQNSSQNLLSFCNKGNREDYSDQIIEGVFHAAPSSEPPTGSLLCMQQGHLSDRLSYPCSMSAMVANKQFDRCGEGHCFPSAQYEHTEPIFEEDRSSRMADLEYFANMDNDSWLDAKVDLNLGSSSWINALASRIQPSDPHEYFPTSSGKSNLFLEVGMYYADRLGHDELTVSDQYGITLQDTVMRPPSTVGLNCNSLDESSKGLDAYSHISGSHSGTPWKITSGTTKQSSWDVFSRLDALNSRIQGLFFSVDSALSKSRCEESLAVNIEETGNLDGKLTFSNFPPSEFSKDNRFDNESGSIVSSGITSNKEVIDIWTLGMASAESVLSDPEDFELGELYASNKSEVLQKANAKAIERLHEGDDHPQRKIKNFVGEKGL